MDSFASSLLYAYLSSPGTAQNQSSLIPLLAIPRADLNLRPEFLYLLKELQLPSQDLIFIDDIPSSILTGKTLSPSSTPQPQPTAKNEVVLVDHNVLQERLFATSRTTVTGIIDHHKDEEKHLDASPRIIAVSGSCSSLVTGWGKSKWSDGKAGKDAAKLALAAILIDTSNMHMRVTDHDRAAVEFLEGKLGGNGVSIIGDHDHDGNKSSSSTPWNSTAFFEKLSTAKASLDPLCLKDILRKDYKQWTTLPSQTSATPTLTIGFSSVVKPHSYLCSTSRGGPAEFLKTLQEFAQERSLDIMTVMTAYNDERTGEFSRELLVWVISEEGVRADYMKRFEKWAKSKEGDMQLVELGEGLGWGLFDGDGRRKAWRQGNTALSRKQVAPGMRGCL